MESPASSRYDDGVYDKMEAQSHYTASQGPVVRGPRLPTLMLVSLVLLLIFCFLGLLLSGLHYANRVQSDDGCLGQSWVMFSSILGMLYIGLHLQAARKGEPVNRKQPCAQHPLHSGCVVIARLAAVGWAVSLIIISVGVSKNPVPVSCVDLVVCVVVTPVIIFILCVDEKAAAPFDLPYLTCHSSSSVITCRVSAIMASMNEVAVEDSISRRGSGRSSKRGNSNTQHAAAIALANSASVGGGLSGPRPPPKTVKEAGPWAFTSFDNKTKDQLAASVTEASHTSAARQWVGGPRALPLSEKAIQTGLLPPPVCFEPKIPSMPTREGEKECAPRQPAAGVQSTSSEPGAWRKDWSTLAAETGYASTPNSTATTPASTPGIGSHGSLRAGSRCLSPVVEVDDRRLSAVAAGAAQRPAIATAFPASQARTITPHVSAPPTPAAPAPGRPRHSSAPQGQAPPAHTWSTHTPGQHGGGGFSSPRPYGSAAGAPAPPPPVASEPRRASSPARIRLTRAQEALRVHGSKTTVAVLRRPQRLAGDRGPRENQMLAAGAAGSRNRPELLRMPGSFEDE